MHLMEYIQDKIEVIRTTNEKSIFLVGPVKLPIDIDGETINFQWYSWLVNKNLPNDKEKLLAILPILNLAELQQSSVLIYGDFSEAPDTLVRFHSICHTGDIFGSQKCDCRQQLKQSLRNIVKNGSGALFYLANHEGRSIGLFNKAMTYLIQELGYDTVQANKLLGFQDDSRDYTGAINVLKKLRSKPISIMTNNPQKVLELKRNGIKVKKHVPLWGKVSLHNKYYIETKVKKAHHYKNGLPLEIIQKIK
ncbi:GTP cyclohydrolase [Bacillus pseudomycoides]|nr:GTP cyclohydrolase II [Bacillus pseudomycoides]PED07008.1 GTP cyclohydrolase [Bacillus pseudomycoides]PEI95026.1 GTP cyclohydrolase [Bacillus pseudomycoides]PEK29662.1 GTP cyclohydrolase [Bacillus pseudomycoides]PEM69768.1 GTP cyclohydrolase [Bacillus pseudomycoides]PEO21649.1 GTP cyclohydrolase [Bacillus pseudomycoides]